MPMRTPTSPVLVPSFTPDKVNVIVWALVTPVRFTVIAVVPLPVVLEMVPVPEVTGRAIECHGTGGKGKDELVVIVRPAAAAFNTG